MPGVVAISGIVPAAKSFPLPFNTGLKISRGAARTILGLSASATPNCSRTAAKACPDLTLLKTIRSAPSNVLLNFSMVDMSYAGLSVRFPRPTPTRPIIGLSPARTFPELASASTKSGSTTTTSAISPSSIRFFDRGPRVARQRHLVVRFAAEKVGNLGQGRFQGTVAHDFDCASITRLDGQKKHAREEDAETAAPKSCACSNHDRLQRDSFPPVAQPESALSVHLRSCICAPRTLCRKWPKRVQYIKSLLLHAQMV